MLSRLHRRAEALDAACLRAQGHPNDYAIRQELLVALEWDETFHPTHAHPSIREVFRHVNEHCVQLAFRLQSPAVEAGDQDRLTHDLHRLRERLSRLVQVLVLRRGEPRAD